MDDTFLVYLFLTHMKNASLSHNHEWVGQPGECMAWQKLYHCEIVIFWDTINVMNVSLCMMALLIELYPFIPLSLTLNIFYSIRDGSVKDF